MNFFKVTLSGGEVVNVVLKPQDNGWVAQVGETEVKLRFLGSDGQKRVSVEIDDETLEIDLDVPGKGHAIEEQLARALQKVMVESAGLTGAAPASLDSGDGNGLVTSPMAGIVLKVLVKEGQTVGAGECVAIIEAMKMENRVETETSGVVTKIHVDVGATLLKGDTLVEVSAAGSKEIDLDENEGASNVTS